MNILIAPNAIQKGLLRSSPSFHCTCFPIGDGGDGTAKLIIEKFNGTYVSTSVRDPLGRVVKSTFGLIEDGKTAVIEMADASGLRLLSADELSPLLASSYGAGELISLALDERVSGIVLCMGGSATVDARIWSTELTILCDVDNQLLGDSGSAAVFGPQKGASADDMASLELALSRFRDVALRKTGKDMALLKHGGTAGGFEVGNLLKLRPSV